MFLKNNTLFFINDYAGQEDGFWGIHVSRKFKWFTVPDMTIAIRFSMETIPRALYGMNNNQLPFGCHKWEVYDLDFWKSFIKY